MIAETAGQVVQMCRENGQMREDVAEIRQQLQQRASCFAIDKRSIRVNFYLPI